MRLCFPACLFLIVSAPVFAQSAAGLAAISGVVRDQSGAAVPKASVVVSNSSLGTVRNLTTNDDGLFTAPALAPASGYKAAVTVPGFGGYENNALDLPVGQNLSFNINLSLSHSA